MTNAQQMEKLVKFRVRDLDAMPFVFRKLMNLLNKPYPSPRELGQVIAADQGMSLRVLRMVNSAAGGLRNQVLSVPQAVSLLGINVVRSLSFCMASYDSFFSSSDDERKELWRHSLLCGLLARTLAVARKVGQPEEMFVAGMLHDIGRSVVIKHCPKKALQLSQRLKQSNDPLGAEVEVLGVTHAEIGAWTCECWKLPPVLMACVRYHHAPQEAGEYMQSAQLIHLADHWSLRALEPNSPELEMFDASTLAALQLSQEQVEHALSEALAQLGEIESYLSGERSVEQAC